MLQRRERTLDWMSQQVYRTLPLSPELQRIKDLFPEETIMKTVRPFYADDMGRHSEDPVLLTKILFLSFFYDIDGDDNTLETLLYRMDWRQFCDLPLDAPLPDRTTLVKFRRQVGLAVIEGMFQDMLVLLTGRGLLDRQHRFFDGTPVKARARINPSRDEVYQEGLKAIEQKLSVFHGQQVTIDPGLNLTPVALTKSAYAADNGVVEARWSQEMKPVAERLSAGDSAARFQRGKHGKRSELGDEVFFSTDGQQLFIEEVIVSAEASQGQQVFLGKLAQSQEGQQWSVDAEFATGEILKTAEEKGVILNTPPRQTVTHGGFSKTEFLYDMPTDTYRCPQGHTLSPRGTNHNNGERHYRPAVGTCSMCPLREQCTTSKTGRTVTRNLYEAEWERQREHTRTPQAVIGKVLRGIIAEGKFAEAVRHGLHSLRYVGKQMAVMQSTLIALILNVKRLLRIETQGLVT
jgi:transposase